MALFAPFFDLLHRLRPCAARPTAVDQAAVPEIRSLAAGYSGREDSALRDEINTLRERVQSGERPQSPGVIRPAFALIDEALRRTRGFSLYDVQLLAGLALARGSIAEMQTGEGKTLVAALPAIVHALGGRGVHVLTVNSYLAERDFEQLAPVIKLLGLSAGFLGANDSREKKAAAYACDITYGPGYEFGFDYLRDQAAQKCAGTPRLGESYRQSLTGPRGTAAMRVQRGFAFAVIDEIDSVLLDEANSPLLLSDGAPSPARNAQAFVIARSLAEELRAERDYQLDSAANSVSLTKLGIEKANAQAERAAAFGLERPWPNYVEQALRARWLYQRDVDYIVSDGRIDIVDQNTGRVFVDRSWRDGLHQAVQAKEGAPILAEQKPLVRISRQRYFRLYDGLCGMTGTATGSEAEFRTVYRLPVTTIPLRKPSQRKRLPTRWFANEPAKIRAIAKEVGVIHATGQPVLVGARTISSTEALAKLLEAMQIPYLLLNGKQDADEAAVIAKAGQVGAVTLATNMAGRGTDIRLGPGAAELGGLHVLGVECHESQRVDRQLAGRAARQGDPGACRFFVSADDQLLCRHAPSLVRRLQLAAGDSGEALGDYTDHVEKAQLKAEREGAVARRQLLAHDDWLEDVLATLVKTS